MSADNETRSSGEYTNFGILIVIMVIVVLVVALLRPLIFGRIVPAVMGEGIILPTSDAPVVEDQEAINVEESAVEPAPVEDTPAEDTPAEDAASDEVDTPPATDEETAETETSPAPSAPITHVVKTGETLTAIAAQYRVTVDAIVAANNIPRRNRIEVGDKLIIPQQ